MSNKVATIGFKVGKNVVFDRDLEGMLGHTCDLAEVAAVAYLLVSKGYTVSEIYSDGFCVVLYDPKEVEGVTECIVNMTNALAMPKDKESEELKAFHKKAKGLYMRAVNRVCTEMWKEIFPDLQPEDIHTQGSSPNGIHFCAVIK